jgi:hypothetical protein
LVVSGTRRLFAGVAVATLVSSGAALATAGRSWADPPATPQPIDAIQAPAMAAMQQLGPAVQQAAADPSSAASLLMAAASAFAGNSAVPDASKQVASSVSQFVQPAAAMPASLSQLLPAGASLPGPGTPPPEAHVPAPGAIPGTDAHLPLGIDPAHAVGPAPDAAPAAAAPEPAAAPAPAPSAAPDPAPAPAPGQPPAAAPAPGFGPDSPPTQEFMYPSIGNGCLKDGGNSLATAISVAGPAAIPKPGPAKGQTAYVFTAVGTPAPAPEQKLPLNVTWVNLTTGKSGGAALKPNPEINPNGPTTLVAIADTGSGSIISTIFGQVTTVDKQCTFMPTIGSTVVP